MLKKLLAFSLLSIVYANSFSQVDEDQTGAWYMYFWSTQFNESKFGAQGDIQWRNWDLGGDLEQLLLRGAFTYSPEESTAKYALGYGNITTGAFGDSDATTKESRVYQEANLPHKIDKKLSVNHRFRYEQRFVESQDFRTRYRYGLFLTLPLSGTEATKGQLYAAAYNELFINGQRDIGDGREVEIFDRNRIYGALGYTLNDKMKIQGGFMRQSTDNWSKNQMQLSLHHSF